MHFYRIHNKTNMYNCLCGHLHISNISPLGLKGGKHCSWSSHLPTAGITTLIWRDKRLIPVIPPNPSPPTSLSTNILS